MPHSDPFQHATLIIEFERNGVFHRTVVQSTDRALLESAEEGSAAEEASAFHRRMGGEVLRVARLESLEIDLPVERKLAMRPRLVA